MKFIKFYLIFIINGLKSSPLEDTDIQEFGYNGIDEYNNYYDNDKIDLSNLGPEAYGTPNYESGKFIIIITTLL